MLWWFAETTLVAGSLAAAAALCGRLKALGAPARHLLWVLVLVKLVTPPVVPAPWSVPLALFPAAGPVEPEEFIATDIDIHTSDNEDTAIDFEDEPATAALAMPVSYSHSADVESGPAILRGPNAAALALREMADAERLRALHRDEPGTATAPKASPAPASIAPAWLPLHTSSELGRWLLLGWAAGAVVLAAAQTRRILAFRGRLRDAVPAPEWLVEEADRIGRSLWVRPPEILVATGIGTPLLWCLGRPRLIVPAHLVKSIDANRWRGILAHELAHLRRGDHWISRLELAAGLLWWWNPLYWIARRRIDAEAELACDAWVVSTLPANRDRHAYAEVLLQLCSELSPQRSRPAPAPSPALGVAGSGRFLERRLLMVLNAHRDDPSACRIAPVPLAAACLLGLLALPSWSLASPVVPPPAFVAEAEQPPAAEADDVDADATIVATEDGDDDDDKDKDKDKNKDKDKSKEKSEAPDDDDADEIAEKIEKTVEDALGPDFEAKMEAWGEKFGAEMEKQFGDGSEFAKKMEAFGKEMEKKFGEGSEFQKQMESFGKEMEKKFGPGSDFEKKFGEGSEFAKKMEGLGKKMEEKFGPGSDFEKKVKEKAEAAAEKAKEHAAKAQQKMAEVQAQAAEARAKAQADRERAHAARDAARDEARKHRAEAEAKADAKPQEKPDRERRIKDLESKVEMLLKEIKALRAED